MRCYDVCVNICVRFGSDTQNQIRGGPARWGVELVTAIKVRLRVPWLLLNLADELSILVTKHYSRCLWYFGNCYLACYLCVLLVCVTCYLVLVLPALSLRLVLAVLLTRQILASSKQPVPLWSSCAGWLALRHQGTFFPLFLTNLGLFPVASRSVGNIALSYTAGMVNSKGIACYIQKQQLGSHIIWLLRSIMVPIDGGSSGRARVDHWPTKAIDVENCAPIRYGPAGCKSKARALQGWSASR